MQIWKWLKITAALPYAMRTGHTYFGPYIFFGSCATHTAKQMGTLILDRNFGMLTRAFGKLLYSGTEQPLILII